MILDTTGYRTAVEHHLAIAQIEFSIEKYREAQHSPSVDARLEAAESLFKATKDAWALLHAISPEMPKIGPLGIA